MRWRPVVGFSEHYEVSDAGLVRSLDRVVTRSNGVVALARGRMLRPCTLKRGGYLAVSLWSGNRGRLMSVHRIVALAFLGPAPTSGHEVNHRDGCKTHNAVENLEWATRSENIRHAIAAGLMPRAGEGNPAAKITDETVRHVRAMYAGGARNREIAAAFGLSSGHVSLIVSRRIWRHVA